MPSTLSNNPQGFGGAQSILTKDYGIRSLSLLEGEEVRVWTGSEWEAGTVINMGRGIVLPTMFSLARPSGLEHMKRRDDGQGWVRRGKRERMTFPTEFMPWVTTGGRELNPMLEDRTVPSAAPIPNLFSDEYQQGVLMAKKVLHDSDVPVGTILGEPTSTDFVFGVIMHFTRQRVMSDDTMRRTLYISRRDIVDWLSHFSPLGGYIMTNELIPKIKLDPANETLGWKSNGSGQTPRMEMNVYQVKGTTSKMMTLGSGILVRSEV